MVVARQGERAYSKADGRALHALAVFKHNALDVVLFVDLDLAHSFAEHDIQTQRSDLLNHHAACVAIQLSTQHPSVPLNQLDFPKVLEIHHCFCGFETEKSAADSNAGGSLSCCRKVNQALEIV